MWILFLEAIMVFFIVGGALHFFIKVLENTKYWYKVFFEPKWIISGLIAILYFLSCL